MKQLTLRSGTLLYHGTDSKANFCIPDGPSWFCTSFEQAAKWAGWGSKGRGGVPRVLVLSLTRHLLLLDTIDLYDWIVMGETLCGYPDPTTYEAARAVREAGFTGWYGLTEIMLTRTDAVSHHDMILVDHGVMPWGRSKSCVETRV